MTDVSALRLRRLTGEPRRCFDVHGGGGVVSARRRGGGGGGGAGGGGGGGKRDRDMTDGLD